MSDAGLKFDPKLYQETEDRIRQNRDFGIDNVRPRFDPALHRDVVDDAKHGRKIEDFHQVLEKTGFRYFTARQRGPFVNGQPRTEGEWVNPQIGAMTSDEICAWFSGPEAFYNWVVQWQTERRARRAGIILPGSR